MVEFDPINNFHLHGNLYYYYPTGTDTVPSFYTDMITLSQTERGIMEFVFDHTGRFLFHAHKVEFSEKGWVGMFLVRDGSNGNSTDATPSAYPEDYDGTNNNMYKLYPNPTASAKNDTSSDTPPWEVVIADG